MDGNKAAYENSLKNLSSSHIVTSRDAVLGESENQLATVGKTFTTDFGNIMLGHVAMTGLGNLSKVGNRLKSLGFSSEDAEMLGKALKNGDTEGIGKLLGRVGSKKLRDGIRKLTGKSLKDSDLPPESQPKPPSEAGQPVQAEEGRPVQAEPAQDEEETSFPKDDDDDEFQDAQEPDEPTPPSAEEDITGDTGDVEANIEQAGTDVVKTLAPEVETTASQALADAAAASAAADAADPLGIIATAGLGIASLLTGLFIKNKKPKVVAPAYVSTMSNFSVQAGLS